MGPECITFMRRAAGVEASFIFENLKVLPFGSTETAARVPPLKRAAL